MSHEEEANLLCKRTLWLMTATQATRPTGRPPPPATPTPARATPATPAEAEADMPGSGSDGRELGGRTGLLLAKGGRYTIAALPLLVAGGGRG